MNRIWVEPTDMCNLNCPSCGRPKGGHTLMSEDTFSDVLDVLILGVINAIGFFWRGEPCMHPRLPSLIRMAKERGMNTYTSSNMVVPNLHNIEYVSELFEYLDKFEVCVDGFNQDTLSRYRIGAKWGDLIKSLDTISKTRSDCYKEMRVLMFGYNDGKEEFFRALARKYKLDSLAFAKPIINMKATISNEEAKEWMSKNPKYQRYKKRNVGTLSRPRWIWEHTTRRCSAYMFRGSIVDVDGNVIICPLDYDEEYSLGNILTDPLSLIKDRQRNMKQKILGMELKMCSNCVCSCVPPVNYREKVKWVSN